MKTAIDGGRRVGKGQPPWIAGFGALSDLADEHRRVLDAIEEEFESRYSPANTPSRS